jgi:uncharacterized pyridoxamine 5'-phosphate oxidase family protein
MQQEDAQTTEEIRKYDLVRKYIQNAEMALDKAKEIISKIEQDEKKEMYKSIPGVEGTFDGVQLVADDGTKHDIPSNYAAKSRLVVGDKLKMLTEDGKQLYKQIQKVERKKAEGVLSKKEGKWYALTDSGSYRISDTAAEFNKAELNDKVLVILPVNTTGVLFAALDKIYKKDFQVNQVTKVASPVSASPVQTRVPEAKKPAPKPVAEVKPRRKPSPKPPESHREFVADIVRDTKPIVTPISPAPATPASLDDDDLR